MTDEIELSSVSNLESAMENEISYYRPRRIILWVEIN